MSDKLSDLKPLAALAAAAMFGLALAVPAHALDQAVQIYGGEGRALDEGGVFEAGLEWQLAPLRWGVAPVIGFLASEESARYAYAGVRREFGTRRWFLAPYVGAGYYDRERGPNLGGTFQFRSGLEIGVEIAGGWRLGASLYHLSNASIMEVNPGTEAVVLTLSHEVLRASRAVGSATPRPPSARRRKAGEPGSARGSATRSAPRRSAGPAIGQ
jgi:hypothetical protein